TMMAGASAASAVARETGIRPQWDKRVLQRSRGANHDALRFAVVAANSLSCRHQRGRRALGGPIHPHLQGVWDKPHGGLFHGGAVLQGEQAHRDGVRWEVRDHVERGDGSEGGPRDRANDPDVPLEAHATLGSADEAALNREREPREQVVRGGRPKAGGATDTGKASSVGAGCAISSVTRSADPLARGVTGG